jgi:hypothetical protein
LEFCKLGGECERQRSEDETIGELHRGGDMIVSVWSEWSINDSILDFDEPGPGKDENFRYGVSAVYIKMRSY